MRRTALRVFFERVIVASLPLAVPACKGTAGSGTTSPPAVTDMAMALPMTDMLESAPSDLLTEPTIDLSQGDMDTCEVTHPVTPANLPASEYPDGGFATLCMSGSPCTDVCPTGYGQCCHPTPSDGGAYLVQCTYNCGPVGRRPAGLEDAHGADGCGVGQYFASMAHLEAASVHAFRTLAHELAEHGAPTSLVAAARSAARDEIRHARLTRTMALAHGSKPAPVRVTRPQRRSIEAIATENAIEGCVRETFGALLATWQARAAGDETVRALMAGIAVDETRHAQLAWAVDAWSKRNLDRAARRRVRAARDAVVETVAAELREPPAAELVAHVGLPDVNRAAQFLAAARRELWS